MSAPKRPGGRPKPPGALAEFRATGTRYRRPVSRRAPDAGPRSAWAFAVIALVMGFGAVVWLVDGTSGPRAAVAATASPTSAERPSVTAPPSPALAFTGGGAGAGTPDRTDRPDATPGATVAPAPAGGRPLTVEFPRDSEVVASRLINAFGRAPSGAAIRGSVSGRELAPTTARDDGLWILQVELLPGVNELHLEVAGDGSSTLTVVIFYQPR